MSEVKKIDKLPRYLTPTYRCWLDMKQRCNNPRSQQYKNYGARGISVCDRWMESFDNFLLDMGEKPIALTIDRIDNSKGYSPDNCRWATKRDQSRNQRTTVLITFNGLTMCRRDWAKKTGLHETTIQYRMNAGWDIEDCLSTKKFTNGNNRKSAMEAKP